MMRISSYFTIFLIFLSLFSLSKSKTIPLIRTEVPTQDLKLPYRNLRATASGIVPITWPVYAVNTDFIDQSNIVGLQSESQKEGLMGLALYTNETFFGGECKNFLRYECEEPDCFQTENLKNITFPYYKVDGYVIHTQLFLDYGFFSSAFMGVIYAENCDPDYTATRNLLYGMIGLGLEGYNWNNFVGSHPAFSIDLDSSGRTGQLIFDCNTDKINKTAKVHSPYTSSNWEIEYDDIVFDTKTIDFSGRAIFDLNLPFVGIPEDLYLELLDDFKTMHKIICFEPKVYLIGCKYVGDYNTLPPIQVGKAFVIPPQVYLHPISLKDHTFNLMLFPVSLEEDDPSVIQVMPGFEDHIILGAPFLQHFYVCFGAKKNLYQVNIFEKDENGNYDLVKLLTFGFAITFPILMCSCFCLIACCKRNPKESAKNDLKEKLVGAENDHHGKTAVNGSRSTFGAAKEPESIIVFEKHSSSDARSGRETNFSFSSSILKKQKSF